MVGIHFLPLAGVFNDDSLYILSALVCMAPIFAALMAKKLGIAVSAITGASVGLILLGFAARGLILVFM